MTKTYITPKNIRFEEPFYLESGGVLPELEIRYEEYGTLNSDKSNTVLLIPALTAHAHAAGWNHPEDKKPGWWDFMIGPGKALDTNKLYIICPSVLGGCSGTTGPTSINPLTQKPYNLSFPMITLKDMVHVQKKLIDRLKITRLKSVIGGSMGGMQTLLWMGLYPEIMDSTVITATSLGLSSQAIAFNEVGRRAIISDPNWNNGDYQDNKKIKGLSVARMLAHITYLSEEAFNLKFGRQLQDGLPNEKHLCDINFQVESYLRHQGKQFVERFDSNCYIYITKAFDSLDLRKDKEFLEGLKSYSGRSLITSFSTDWLFPKKYSLEILEKMLKLKLAVSFCEIKSAYGHDSFLLPRCKDYQELVSSFMAGLDL